VNANELRRWLKQHGCIFEEGTRHTVVRLGKRQTTIPRHPSRELKTGTVKSILKRLGLK
jgi:mRNA interferase HicA